MGVTEPTAAAHKPCGAATEHHSHPRDSRNGTDGQSFFALSVFVCEVLMTFQAKESACAFAWRNYLLLHSGISEDDHRRSALHRYLTDLGDAGDFDFDLLQIAAVNYLKSLDELHDDRGARLAADQVLAKRVHSADNAA